MERRFWRQRRPYKRWGYRVSVTALTIGSLFAGVGGFDLGFERTGFDTAWVVEWDKDCHKVLRRHFPKAKLYGDITTVNPDELEKVDVISYGFPCTDLSVAGKRKGLKHDGENTRSGLFFEAVRIIQHIQPRLAVFENVPGLLSSSRGRDFAVVLRELARIGYGETVYVTRDSQHFGVAQRRRRVFGISAHSSCPGLAERCAEEIHAQSKGVCGDSATGEEAGEGTPASVEDGAGSGGEYPTLSRSLRARANSAHREDADTYIPEVVGSLTDEAHSGGGEAARTPTPDASLPSVAWTLQERDAKGADSSTKPGHLIVEHE